MTEQEKLNIAYGYEKDFNDTNYALQELAKYNDLSRFLKRRFIKSLRKQAENNTLSTESQNFLNGLGVTVDRFKDASRRLTREFINLKANPLNNDVTNLLNLRRELYVKSAPITLKNADTQLNNTINDTYVEPEILSHQNNYVTKAQQAAPFVPKWSPASQPMPVEEVEEGELYKDQAGNFRLSETHLSDEYKQLLEEDSYKRLKLGQTLPRWLPDNLTELQGNNLRSFVLHIGNLGEDATDEQYQLVYNTFLGFDKDKNGGFLFNADGSVYYKDNAGRDVYFLNGQLQAKSGNNWTPILARTGESGYLSLWSPISNANASTVTTALSQQLATALNTSNTTPVLEDKELSWFERFMSFIPSYSYH